MKMAQHHPLLGVWRALPPDQQRDLARDIAREVLSRRLPKELEEALSRALKFRTATLHRASEDGLAGAVRAGFPFVEPLYFFRILVQVHFGARAAVLSRVYDGLCVHHDGTHVEPEVLSSPLEIDQLTSRFGQLRGEPEEQALRLCLQVMRHACNAEWRPGVEAALSALAIGTVAAEPVTASLELGGAEPSAVPSLSPAPAASPEETENVLSVTSAVPPAAPEFTQLDRLLIRAVVSSLNQVDGSVGELERSDLVLELVHLNESRSQSWFHLGFLDALEGRPLAEIQRGDNRERRAWYLSGFLHGTHRIRQDGGALHQLAALDDSDRDRLLGNGSEGGALAAGLVAPALLKTETPAGAIPWLRLYAGRTPAALVKPVLAWSRRALVNQAPQGVADILEATIAGLDSAPQSEESPPAEVVRALRRRLAIAWRRLRRLDEARAIVENLLADSPDGEERSRLLCDQALLTLGIGSLEDLRLGHPDTRPALLSTLKDLHPLLEEATRCSDRVAVAHYLLGVTGLLEGGCQARDLIETSAAFSRALSAMSTDEPGFWRDTGVQAQCEFLHAVCELRLLEEARAVPAVQQVSIAVDTGTDLPEDLLFEAINCAAELNAPQVSILVEKLLQRQPARVLRELDLRQVAMRNDGLRQLAVRLATEHEDGLRAEERWRVWSNLLRAALDAPTGRDIETARLALDALERVAWTSSMTEPFLSLLADSKNWECAWEERDYLEARVSALRQLGRWAEAQEEIARMAWQAVQRGDNDAAAWIELLTEVGGTEETLEALSRSLAANQREELRTRVDRARDSVPPPVRVLFIGGNETQEHYEARLRSEFEEAHPESSLEFEFSAWSSNWGRLIDRLSPKIMESSAIVLMRFVRTEFGRKVRHLATRFDVPWVPCSGHGFDSLSRSIEEAVRVGENRERERRSSA